MFICWRPLEKSNDVYLNAQSVEYLGSSESTLCLVSPLLIPRTRTSIDNLCAIVNSWKKEEEAAFFFGPLKRKEIKARALPTKESTGRQHKSGVLRRTKANCIIMRRVFVIFNADNEISWSAVGLGQA